MRIRLSSFWCPAKAADFGGDAFLQAAVPRETDDFVVKNRVLLRVESGLSHLRGNRHSDRVPDALPQWTGGRLNPGRVAEFRVSGSFAVELPEVS